MFEIPIFISSTAEVEYWGGTAKLSRQNTSCFQSDTWFVFFIIPPNASKWFIENLPDMPDEGRYSDLKDNQ